MRTTTRLLIALAGIAAIAAVYILHTTLIVEVPLFVLGLSAIAYAVFWRRGKIRGSSSTPGATDYPGADLPACTIQQLSFYTEPVAGDLYAAAIIEMPEDGTVYERVDVVFNVLDLNSDVVESNSYQITLRPGRNLATADLMDLADVDHPTITVSLDGRDARAVPEAEFGRIEVSPLEVERGDGDAQLSASIVHRAGTDDRELWLDTRTVIRGAEGEIVECDDDSFGWKAAGFTFPYRAYLDSLPDDAELEVFVEVYR
ncbi:hypothetical protein [Microbacterium karelineae]|uniref:hypothetical protein n=1 Tax=Microbacterium karelineae TaxID=2654283 RepID=UPI0012E9CC7B|nr:hypothetical protein [Microbacterium karelineae]